jgi:hypothetical protein
MRQSGHEPQRQDQMKRARAYPNSRKAGTLKLNVCRISVAHSYGVTEHK